MSRKYCQNIFWSAACSAPSLLSVSQVQKSSAASWKLCMFHVRKWSSRTWMEQLNWSGRRAFKKYQVLPDLNLNWFLTIYLRVTFTDLYCNVLVAVFFFMTRTKISSRKEMNLLESVPLVTTKLFHCSDTGCWLVKHLLLWKPSRQVLVGYGVEGSLQRSLGLQINVTLTGVPVQTVSTTLSSLRLVWIQMLIICLETLLATLSCLLTENQ